MAKATIAVVVKRKDARTLLLGGNLSRRQLVPLKTPDGDCDVEVRSLSVRGRTAMVRACTVDGAIDQERLYAAAIISATFVPGTNDRVFTEADRDAILDQEGAALIYDELADAALTLNGLSDKSQAEAEKN